MSTTTLKNLQLPADKLAETGITIFSVMSQLANEHGAINLSQGFPNFPIDPALGDLVEKHIRSGKNQYAPMPGLVPLREAISEKTVKCAGRMYDPESEITVTAGATQAIYTAIAATVSPGDEVILFAPAYDCYAPAILLHGGIPVYISLLAPDFRVDWPAVKAAMNSRTRLIMINTPHNPSATVWTKEDLLALEELTRGTDTLIISDEVYEHMVFDGQKHASAASFEGLHERSFVISSFGKTFHATGWKVGYVCAPAPLMALFRKIHQYLVFSVNTPMQAALAEYLSEAQHYLGLPEFYRAKRDIFLTALSGSRFSFKPAEGTYFQVLDYSAISHEDELPFAKRLIAEHGVASIPFSGFYPGGREQKILRFCFAKTNETLLAAGQILRNL